jgi:hypothetical protein
VRAIRPWETVLLVDNGDVNSGYGRQPELKYETAMKAMAAMDYAAVNVGEEDLLLGSDYLRYVADFTAVPLVSANLVDYDGQPIFEPYLLPRLTKNGAALTAAVIGIISTTFREDIEFANPHIIVEDYVPILEEILESIQGEADIVVLLAHMNEIEAGELVEQFPQIDIIIASHCGDDPFLSPLLVNDVPVGFAGTGGTNVGVARFDLDAETARLASYSAVQLDGTFGESARIQVLLEEYQQMVRAENLLEALPRIEHGQAYFTGNESCVRCHSLPTIRFRKDKHAHAFDVIREGDQEYDPECVQCHTVGFGYESGFISVDKTPDLVHVGCEDCHGPGSKHIENPRQERYAAVEEETCVSCHNLENSPNFVYEEYVKKINHNSFFLCSAKVCHLFD